jgi:hypothetical protein
MPLKHPTPAEITASREAAGLTQAQAAELVHLGAQPRWAEYENGLRPIDLARWELFLIKIQLAMQHMGTAADEATDALRSLPKIDLDPPGGWARAMGAVAQIIEKARRGTTASQSKRRR